MNQIIADIQLFLKKREKNRGKQRKKGNEKTVRGIKLNINQRTIPVWQSLNEGNCTSS